jgi:hypothetical protein
MLWDIAKRYNTKIRFQYRLSKIVQSNAADSKFEDIEEAGDDADES